MTAARWAAWIARHTRAVLVGSLLLGAAAALSLTRLRLEVDVLAMLPTGTPEFDDFKTFIADFGRLDELVLLIEGPREARERYADRLAARLAALEPIARVHGRVDGARIADELLGPYLFNYLPIEAYDEVAERFTPAGMDAQVSAAKVLLAAPFDVSLARAVAADPLGLRRVAARHLADLAGDTLPSTQGGYVTARDGGALLMFARPRGSPFDIPFSTALLADVQASIDATSREIGEPGVRVGLTGSYLFALEDAAAMRGDIHRYTLLSLAGVVAVFWFGYGSLRILPFVTYPLALSVLLAFAVSLLVFGELNAISLSFAAILYGLSIDSAIHFYSRLVEERRRTPDVVTAVAATLSAIGRANIASSGTTAAAFLVIGLSCLGTVRQLGVSTAAGMLITMGQFFILYPALGFVFLRRAAGGLRDLQTPHLAAWAGAAERRARAVRVATVIAAALCAVAAVRVRLDPTLTRLRPADSPALRVQEEIETRFARASSAGAVLVERPDVQAALVDAERVAAQLRRYQGDGVVQSVSSIDPIVPSAAVQRARLERYGGLPSPAAARQLEGALRAHGFKPERFRDALERLRTASPGVIEPGDPALLPLELALERHVKIGNGTAAVAIHVDPGPAADWRTLAARLRADLPDLQLAVAARPLLERALHDVLRRELALFIALAVAANVLLLMVIFRDVRTALAVLTPVLLVVLLLFTAMWATGVPLDPVNLVVTPLILGIGVDNGVYVAEEAQARGTASAALQVVGRAIALTSLSTIVGFGFLAFSTYPPLAAMGRLVAAGLALCLAATIWVLPAFLPRSNARRSAALASAVGHPRLGSASSRP